MANQIPYPQAQHMASQDNISSEHNIPPQPTPTKNTAEYTPSEMMQRFLAETATEQPCILNISSGANGCTGETNLSRVRGGPAPVPASN